MNSSLIIILMNSSRLNAVPHILAVFFDLFSENFSHIPLNPYFSIPLTMFLLLSSSSSTLCKKLNNASRVSGIY